MKVEQLMTSDVKTCLPLDTLNRAAQLMWENDCGCIPVIDGEARVIGVLTDRDICMAAYTQGKTLGELPVVSAMSKELFSCGSRDMVAAAEKVMRANQIRRLPVVDSDGHLVGLLSLSDIARAARPESKAKGKKDVGNDEVAATLEAISERRIAKEAAASAA